jgi:hypothetical protein
MIEAAAKKKQRRKNLKSQSGIDTIAMDQTYDMIII